MSTITKGFTKEQLIARADHLLCVGKAFIAEHPGYDGMAKDVELFKIALASLEAEAVAWLYSASFERGHVEGELTDAPGCDMPVYAAPPAPVSVPDEVSWEDVPEEITEDDMALASAWAHGFNQCRAAMLQGADEVGSWNNNKNTPTSRAYDEHVRYESNAGENLWIQCSKQKYERMKAAGMLTRVLTRVFYDTPQNQQQNIPEIIPTLREAVDTIRSSGIAIDGEKILAERDALNSPVIPDGWALVPAEPTAEMLQSGISAHYERSQIQIHDRPAPGPMECAYVAMVLAAPQQEVK